MAIECMPHISIANPLRLTVPDSPGQRITRARLPPLPSFAVASLLRGPVPHRPAKGRSPGVTYRVTDCPARQKSAGPTPSKTPRCCCSSGCRCAARHSPALPLACSCLWLSSSPAKAKAFCSSGFPGLDSCDSAGRGHALEQNLRA